MSGTNDKCPAVQAGQGHSPPYIEGGVSRMSQVGIPPRSKTSSRPWSRDEDRRELDTLMSSPKTISGQSQNYFGTMGGEVVPKSRIPIDTGLWDYPVPSVSAPIRILLSEAVTTHLETHGGECFLVIAKDKSDQHTGRLVINLLPCSTRAARDAEAVATGKAKAAFPKPPKSPPAAPLTAAQIRSAKGAKGAKGIKMR